MILGGTLQSGRPSLELMVGQLEWKKALFDLTSGTIGRAAGRRHYLI